MKYAVILNSKDPETVWNAFRFSAASVSRGHKVAVFLLGPAVEIDTVDDSRFEVKKVVRRFLGMGGEALSCGTCLKVRKMSASELCPMSTMDTLVALTEDSDRVVNFG